MVVNIWVVKPARRFHAKWRPKWRKSTRQLRCTTTRKLSAERKKKMHASKKQMPKNSANPAITMMKRGWEEDVRVSVGAGAGAGAVTADKMTGPTDKTAPRKPATFDVSRKSQRVTAQHRLPATAYNTRVLPCAAALNTLTQPPSLQHCAAASNSRIPSIFVGLTIFLSHSLLGSRSNSHPPLPLTLAAIHPFHYTQSQAGGGISAAAAAEATAGGAGTVSL